MKKLLISIIIGAVVGGFIANGTAEALQPINGATDLRARATAVQFLRYEAPFFGAGTVAADNGRNRDATHAIYNGWFWSPNQTNWRSIFVGIGHPEVVRYNDGTYHASSGTGVQWRCYYYNKPLTGQC